jgi:hypothetical protein
MKRSALTRWLALSVPLILTACATIGPPQPPSLDLPKPPSDLRVSRKGDRVTLTWTLPRSTTDRETIRSLGPTRICRGFAELKECGTPVGQAPAQKLPTNKSGKSAEASYTDAIPAEMERNLPDVSATYAVEVLNSDGRGAGLSNEVRVPLLRTDPPPGDFRAAVTKDGIVLRWSRTVSKVDPESPVHYVYRIYRRPEENAQWSLVGDIPAGGENDTALTDSGIEWEKTYRYRAATVTVSAQTGSKVQVEGDDTPEATVFADDVFPPAVPTAVQAVFSGPGQKPFIDLVWGPVSDADLAGYNVYRMDDDGAANKINPELVRAPAYRDTNVQSGKRYTYWVSSVDLRGNESARSEQASESVP